MEISVLAAFLGGVLSLLSPCGALLLPGFFASSLTSRVQLVPHGLVFYVGLLLTLVPLGIGVGALGLLFAQHRGALIAVTSLVLIGLGAAHALGLGVDLSRLLPGFDRVRQRASRGTGYVRTLLLGAVGGVAGFCAGPILGAVLTLAMGQADVLAAGFLLAVYGAGMVVPLMLLAALWDVLGGRGRAVLRGRTVTLRGRELHLTSLVTGLVFMALGVLFWVTNGLVTLPSLVPTSALARWQESGAVLSDPTVQILVILGAAMIALLWWWVGRRRAGARPRAAAASGAAVGPGNRGTVRIRTRDRADVAQNLTHCGAEEQDPTEPPATGQIR